MTDHAAIINAHCAGLCAIGLSRIADIVQHRVVNDGSDTRVNDGLHLLRGALECAPMTAPSDTEVDIARAFGAMTGPLTIEQREAYEHARFAVLRACR
jgi:hypothetical protein